MLAACAARRKATPKCSGVETADRDSEEKKKNIAKCIARRADDNDRCRNYRQMEKDCRATEEAAGCGLDCGRMKRWRDNGSEFRARGRVTKKRGKITEVRVLSARGRKEGGRGGKKEKKERRKGG